MTPWWVALAAAGIAVVGGLAGGCITHLLTARRDQAAFDRLTERQDIEWQHQREDKLRDVRAQLYLDVMEFLEDLHQLLDWEPADGRRSMPTPVTELLPRVRLSARIKLYGDAEVGSAWQAVEAAYIEILDAEHEGGILAFRKEFIDATRVAVTELQGLLRARVQSTDDFIDVRA